MKHKNISIDHLRSALPLASMFIRPFASQPASIPFSRPRWLIVVLAHAKGTPSGSATYFRLPTTRVTPRSSWLPTSHADFDWESVHFRRDFAFSVQIGIAWSFCRVASDFLIRKKQRVEGKPRFLGTYCIHRSISSIVAELK